jgi:predicted O-methyltransferase YrrM
MVTMTLGDAHLEVAKLEDPIELLFIDADKASYIDYLNKLLPLVRPGGLIVSHNTTGSAAEVKDYVEAVNTNPDLDTVFMDATDRGMAVTLKER